MRGCGGPTVRARARRGRVSPPVARYRTPPRRGIGAGHGGVPALPGSFTRVFRHPGPLARGVWRDVFMCTQLWPRIRAPLRERRRSGGGVNRRPPRPATRAPRGICAYPLSARADTRRFFPTPRISGAGSGDRARSGVRSATPCATSPLTPLSPSLAQLFRDSVIARGSVLLLRWGTAAVRLRCVTVDADAGSDVDGPHRVTRGTRIVCAGAAVHAADVATWRRAAEARLRGRARAVARVVDDLGPALCGAATPETSGAKGSLTCP